MSATRRKQPVVLCVDDDADSLRLSVACLEMAGLATLAASGGDEAVELARQVVPDCILLDLRMPGLGGLDVARQLRRHEGTAHIPIIAFSASAYPEDRAAALTAGCVGFLEKPAEPVTLTSVVMRVLGHAPRTAAVRGD